MARPRSEAARQKMLDAATELTLDVGIRNFTIDELARRSGVAKTTIYRHFSTKNEIIVAALDGVTPVPEVPNTGSLEEDIAIFLANVFPIFRSDKLRTLFLDVLAAATFDQELASLKGAMLGARGGALMTIVSRARARGEIPEGLDQQELVTLIEGPFIVRSLGDPRTLDHLDINELAATIVRRINA